MSPGRECTSGSSFYQLCYSPLFGNFSDHILHLVGFRCLRGGSAQVVVRSTNCANAPYGCLLFGTDGSITQDFGKDKSFAKKVRPCAVWTGMIK